MGHFDARVIIQPFDISSLKFTYIMNKAPIRLGDSITQGGQVMTATSSFIIDDRPIALRGDLINCSKHGINKIVDGDDGYIEHGRPIALHRSRGECGCSVLASTKAAEF